jgi:hypothetical protein
MLTYLVRDEETLEPLDIFPAKTELDAGVILRKNFPVRPVEMVNISNWNPRQKAEALIEIISNCPVHL